MLRRSQHIGMRGGSGRHKVKPETTAVESVVREGGSPERSLFGYGKWYTRGRFKARGEPFGAAGILLLSTQTRDYVYAPRKV